MGHIDLDNGTSLAEKLNTIRLSFRRAALCELGQERLDPREGRGARHYDTNYESKLIFYKGGCTSQRSEFIREYEKPLEDWGKYFCCPCAHI